MALLPYRECMKQPEQGTESRHRFSIYAARPCVYRTSGITAVRLSLRAHVIWWVADRLSGIAPGYEHHAGAVLGGPACGNGLHIVECDLRQERGSSVTAQKCRGVTVMADNHGTVSIVDEGKTFYRAFCFHDRDHLRLRADRCDETAIWGVGDRFID